MLYKTQADEGGNLILSTIPVLVYPSFRCNFEIKPISLPWEIRCLGPESTHSLLNKSRSHSAQKMRFLLGLSTFASLVAFAVARSLEVRHEPSFAKRYAHHRVARDLDRPLTNEVAVVGARDLEKRFEGSRFTFYDAGQGSCGKTNVNSDFVSNRTHLVIWAILNDLFFSMAD